MRTNIISITEIRPQFVCHYGDVKMGAIASQITSLTIVYSTVYADADQRKHQSPASLAFVRGIHRGPVNSPHKWPITRKMFPFDDVIMVPDDVMAWKRFSHYCPCVNPRRQVPKMRVFDVFLFVFPNKHYILLVIPGVTMYLCHHCDELWWSLTVSRHQNLTPLLVIQSFWKFASNTYSCCSLCNILK